MKTPYEFGDGAVAEIANLDALIVRDDFLATDQLDIPSSKKGEVQVSDLRLGDSFYSTLRKPDFQRETASWKPEAVRDFIKAFLDGDLIPSIVCWQSPTHLSFVIDGAHRLSAIIGWILDDFGAGEKSVQFYQNKIPVEQRRIAEKTQALIKRDIGTYAEYLAETKNPGSNPKLTEAARSMAHRGMPLLWIPSADSRKAERAFFIINQSAAPIDPTELKILNSRFQPNAIVARAIVRNASGHRYWEKLSKPAQTEIEETAREIYKGLYTPPIEPPVRTEELPIAGHGYGSQTLPLIFDLVNIANDVPVVDTSKDKKQKNAVERPEIDEQTTLQFLRNTDKLVRRITGKHASSFGLHPAVYFYSLTSRHQPTAVLAMAQLIMDLDKGDKYLSFAEARAGFESFLVSHKMYINQLTVRSGSMAKGFKPMKEYFAFVLGCVMAGQTEAEIEQSLQSHDKYQTLVNEKPITTKKSKDFSAEAKQHAFMSQALSQAFVCNICGARIDKKSMQLDHKIAVVDGGIADTANAQWVHPFCNSTYKNYKDTKTLANALETSE